MNRFKHHKCLTPEQQAYYKSLAILTQALAESNFTPTQFFLCNNDTALYPELEEFDVVDLIMNVAVPKENPIVVIT